MNSIIIRTLAVVLLIGGIVGSARANDRSDIDALYTRLEQALKNRTPEVTLELETPDFRSIGANGKASTGRQLVEQMKRQDAGVKSVKDVTIAVKRATITGKTARVVTDFRYTVMVDDKDGHLGPKGATHEMGMRGDLKNDLVKTAAGWRFRTMETGRGKVLIDGKPVRNPAPGTTRKVPK